MQADGDITLEARRDIHLLAAENTEAVSSNSKGSSAGLGVTFGVGQQNGISFQIGASQMKGVTEGEAITYDNTQVTAGNTLTLKSGGDTTLRGAQVGGERVVADIGGNLAIETLQDESRDKSRQKESGFSLSICVPPICYGMSSASANAANQKVDHNYRSAQGQSGIAAGDGGFDIRVAGDTHLKGGAITSDAGTEKNRLTTRSLSFEDLTNEQHTDASSSSFSIAGSTDLSQSLMPSPSNGLAGQAANNLLGNLAAQSGLPDSGSETSQTLAVISPATINITGNDAASREAAETLTSRDPATANQSLTDTLTLQDAARVERKMQEAKQNGQAAALIGQVVAGMIGDLSAAMRKPINDANDRLALDAKQRSGEPLTNVEQYELARLEREGMTSAQAEKTLADPAALANYKNWEDGGLNKTILHGLAGLIQAKVGDGSALVGAASGALNEALLPAMDAYLQEQGITDPEAYKGYLQLGSALLGAGIGAVADGAGGAALGGTVAHSATTYNFLSHEDSSRRLRLKDEKNACRDDACRTEKQREIDRLDQLDVWRDQQIEQACQTPSSTGCQAWVSAIQVAAQSYYGQSGNNIDYAERATVQTKAFEYKQAADNPFLHGVGTGLLKLTPPGLVVGAIGGIGALVESLVENGAGQTLANIANGIQGFPADLKVRLNSPDPTIRGEALVDAVALAMTGTALTAGAMQYSVNVVEKAAIAKALAKADEGAIAKAKVENSFYKEGASSNPPGLYTSAGIIPANPSKTTTVLGRYSPDMDGVINQQMGAIKSDNFGAAPGGFNVLNVDDAAAKVAGVNFFEQYNKPFLDQALKRGDDIALGTMPKRIDDIIYSNGQLKGNFAKEIDYLVKNNYKPVNVTAAQWEMIKGWFK